MRRGGGRLNNRIFFWGIYCIPFVARASRPNYNQEIPQNAYCGRDSLLRVINAGNNSHEGERERWIARMPFARHAKIFFALTKCAYLHNSINVIIDQQNVQIFTYQRDCHRWVRNVALRDIFSKRFILQKRCKHEWANIKFPLIIILLNILLWCDFFFRKLCYSF